MPEKDFYLLVFLSVVGGLLLIPISMDRIRRRLKNMRKKAKQKAN
jgi:hypothetical protein